MKNIFRVIFAIVLSMGSWHVFADDHRIDGNWWQGQSRSEKIGYIIGFWDGRRNGYRDASQTWDTVLMLSLPKKFDPNALKFAAGIEEAAAESIKNQLSGHETVGQMIEGLDSFYGDFKNRLIFVSHAMDVVNSSIIGTPENELEKTIEELRKKDSDN